MTADQLFLILQKDQPYYVQSGGGVTFSGGECMLYPDFLFEVMELCKNSGIHVAVESALNVPYANLEKVLPVCDLWLVDFKHPDTVEHKQYTGCGNERIQENLAKLCKSGSNILVRCPMIPGVNDIPETVRQLAEAVYALGAPHVELLKYNPLGKSKYNRLGLPFTPFAEDPQSDEQMRILCGQMNATVQKCDFVFFTP